LSRRRGASSVAAATAVIIAVAVGWTSNFVLTVEGPCGGDGGSPYAEPGSPADEFCMNGGPGIVWLLPVAVVGLGYRWQRRHDGTTARLGRAATTAVAAIAVNTAAVELIQRIPDGS
jgi:hypothetical protein